VGAFRWLVERTVMSDDLNLWKKDPDINIRETNE
jgi:hypothetical protein